MHTPFYFNRLQDAPCKTPSSPLIGSHRHQQYNINMEVITAYHAVFIAFILLLILFVSFSSLFLYPLILTLKLRQRLQTALKFFFLMTALKSNSHKLPLKCDISKRRREGGSRLDITYLVIDQIQILTEKGNAVKLICISAILKNWTIKRSSQSGILKIIYRK